jgi:hypothetical protein
MKRVQDVVQDDKNKYFRTVVKVICYFYVLSSGEIEI